MKKILFAFVAGLISALAVTNETHAQSLEAIASAQPLKHDYDYKYKIGNTDVSNNSNTIALDLVNAKALKNFRKYYKANNEKWSMGTDCINATYYSDNVSYFIYYDKKGHWTGSLKSYQEDKLSKDIRKMVTREYYDYKIVLVQEVETVAASLQPTYIVTIQGEKDIKLLRIQDDNMDVYRVYISNFKRS